MLERLSAIIFLILSFSVLLNAQNNKTSGVAAYLEIGGKGFISANMDFPIASKDRLALGLTLLDHEFAKKDTVDENFPTNTLPTPSIMYMRLFGKEKHFLEAGGGVSVSPVFWKKYSENDSFLSLHAVLGYRYQVANRFFFRAGFTPFYRVRWALLPLVGISVGYSW